MFWPAAYLSVIPHMKIRYMNKLKWALVTSTLLLVPSNVFAHGFSRGEILFMLLTVLWPFIVAVFFLMYLVYRLRKKQPIILPLVLTIAFFLLGAFQVFQDINY